MNGPAISGQSPAAAYASLRHVRRLRVVAGSEQEGQRALRLLEEALRLITLPGESIGKIFYFRRLQLPPLAPDDTSPWYACQVEERCRQMARSAVHFSNPSARDAEVVFAWSPIEPYRVLARLAAHSLPPAGWFWRTAIPDALPMAASGSALPVLLQVAERYGDDGLVEFLDRLERDVLHSILDDLKTEHVSPGGPLRIATPAPLPQTPGEIAMGRKLLDRLPALWRELAREYNGRWGTGERDLRIYWLIGAAWRAAEPERALDPRMPEQVAAIVGALRVDKQFNHLPKQRGDLGHAGILPAPDRAGSVSSESALSDIYDHREASSPVGPIIQPQWRTEATHQARNSNQSSGTNATPAPWLIRKSESSPSYQTALDSQGEETSSANEACLADLQLQAGASDREIVKAIRPIQNEAALPTAYAGIFYCLGLLERMGIEKTLEAHPELIDLGFIRHLLQALALAAGAGDDDPILRHDLWLNPGVLPQCQDGPLTFSCSMLPVSWRSHDSDSPAWPAPKLVRAWVLAVRQAIWRATGMTLAGMAARPGNFIATRTHIEITLPQDSLEVRIRKAGLDLNPGWLAWLGRVVTFRYSCQVLEVIPAGGMRRSAPMAFRMRRGRSAGAGEMSSE